MQLLFIIVTLIVDNVEESQLIDTLASRNNPQPVSQLLLLEEFLRQVLQVSSRERNVRDNFDLAIASLGDGDLIAEVTGSALDLDLVVEEFLESGEIENLIRDGLGAVDGVLLRNLALLNLASLSTASL